ncbi:MAG: hypothetical protein HGB12_18095 [Bacteroidetes bacterium]|nr:hypothetical protein [Bacteroidota bacterium]
MKKSIKNKKVWAKRIFLTTDEFDYKKVDISADLFNKTANNPSFRIEKLPFYKIWYLEIRYFFKENNYENIKWLTTTLIAIVALLIALFKN